MKRNPDREAWMTGAEGNRRYQLFYPRPTDKSVARKLKVEIFRQQAKIAELQAELAETRTDLARERNHRKKLEAQLKRLPN